MASPSASSAPVEERAARASSLESAVQSVPEGKLADNARLRLVRMLRREGRFLERMRGGELTTTIARLASSNLTHVEGLLAWLSSESVSGVTDVMVNVGKKKKNSKKAATANDDDAVEIEDDDVDDNHTVHVDMIGLVDGRVTWVVIFGGRLQPKALRVRVFDAKMQRLLQAASAADVTKKPVCILLHFVQGAPAAMVELLQEEFGAFPWEHPTASHMPAGKKLKKKKNLLATFNVSSLAKRQPCLAWMKLVNIMARALSELEAPLLPELESHMQDRTLLVPESTLREYHNIISTIAGPRQEHTSLRASSRVQPRHKVVFGTADTLRLPVLSANTSFVRAAHQAGVPVNVLVHRPRALSGE
eukprot:jgi/Chlat1/953/Chrsp108S01432